MTPYKVDVSNTFIPSGDAPINGYSEFSYDIPGAILNGVVYPSLDPSIFEVKYPQSDIQGRVVTM
jgi:hypothetical protein